MTGCIASTAVSFHCPRWAPAAHCLPCVGAGTCSAGFNAANLRRRYLELCEAAASHPAWEEQWGGYREGSIGLFLSCGDARQARLALLIERGQQRSYTMSTVLHWTDTRWGEVLQKLALQRADSTKAGAQQLAEADGGAAGAGSPARGRQVRQRRASQEAP
jgi:hypothetical protein